MRISDSVRDTVVFLGHPTNEAGKSGIECVGTGFLLMYDEVPHLITARHVAEHFADHPFLIRVNTCDQKAENIPVDMVKWYYPKDPAVDVAATPFELPRPDRYVVRHIDFPREALSWTQARKFEYGIGDFVYTVGLFRLLAGTERNMPVVHFGTIARTVDWDEKVPVKDWQDPAGKKTLQTNAYLVESQSLSGLSGSPVFVRATSLLVRPEMFVHNPGRTAEDLGDAVARWKVHLLGMWQGAWDAPPDEVLGLERGRQVRVLVGMGVVIPTEEIHYLLEEDELKVIRRQIKEQAQSASDGPG
jgi:hypothetical protein